MNRVHTSNANQEGEEKSSDIHGRTDREFSTAKKSKRIGQSYSENKKFGHDNIHYPLDEEEMTDSIHGNIRGSIGNIVQKNEPTLKLGQPNPKQHQHQ